MYPRLATPGFSFFQTSKAPLIKAPLSLSSYSLPCASTNFIGGRVLAVLSLFCIDTSTIRKSASGFSIEPYPEGMSGCNEPLWK